MKMPLLHSGRLTFSTLSALCCEYQEFSPEMTTPMRTASKPAIHETYIGQMNEQWHLIEKTEDVKLQ